MDRRVVIGLGNPGEQYARTRHNAGFWLVERLGRSLNITWNKQADLYVAETVVDSVKVTLVKPQKFMNRSGAVSSWVQKQGIAHEDILIATDDVYIKPGSIRYRVGGGHGGHNGLRSLIAAGLGDTPRMRIGVGVYPQGVNRPQETPPLDHYVLAPLPTSELQQVHKALDQALPTVLDFCRSGSLPPATSHHLLT